MSARDELAQLLGRWHRCLDEVGGRPLACGTCELVADALAVVYAEESAA